jgi:hypothetical protein
MKTHELIFAAAPVLVLWTPAPARAGELPLCDGLQPAAPAIEGAGRDTGQRAVAQG